MWGVSPFDQLWCRIQFRRRRYEGMFTPQTHKAPGSILHPGHYGVFSWGGVAVDEGRGLLIVSPSYVGYTSRLLYVQRSDKAFLATGNALQGQDADPFPKRPYVSDARPFVSPLGIPCNSPPWGEIAAVDLLNNRVVWRRPVGDTRERAVLGIRLSLGVPSLGGPIVTKGGLVFFSGTIDNQLRAFDVLTGAELWQAHLPAGGQSTPMTYVSHRSGRQFLVVAAGGHAGLGTTYGDSLLAFALP
jgi:quinoprotein glucose dehydrogenase